MARDGAEGRGGAVAWALLRFALLPLVVATGVYQIFGAVVLGDSAPAAAEWLWWATFLVYPVALYLESLKSTRLSETWRFKHSKRTTTPAAVVAACGAVPIVGPALTLLLLPGVYLDRGVRRLLSWL
jgi:hypothetical protein